MEDSLHRLSNQKITSIPYGKIPPKHFKSPLNNHDWILKYLGGPPKNWNWDYPALVRYRKMIDNKTFKLMHREAGKSVSDVGIYTRDLLEKVKFGVITAGRGMRNKIYDSMYYNLRLPTIRQDYGDIVAKTDKTLGWMTTVYEPDAGLDPPFQIITRGGEIIGSHMDKLYFHDIIQEQFKSFESNESLLIRYEEVWQYCADWIGGCGTRKGLNDFYSEMMKRGFKFFYEPALVLLTGRWPEREDCVIDYFEEPNTGRITEQIRSVDTSVGTFQSSGCPNWPLEKLIIKRIEGLYAFESQMNNNPLARSSIIKWADFQPYKVTYDDTGKIQLAGRGIKEFNWLAFYDDATGESLDANYRSIVLMAKHKYTDRYYMYDQMVGHTKWIGKKKIDNITTFIEDKEQELGIRILLYVECVKNQRETFQRLRDESSLYVREANPRDRGKKIDRILDGLVTDLEHHKIFIREDLRFRGQLMDEVIGFPDQKHIDLLDSWDQVQNKLKKPHIMPYSK